jgi:carboxyl-terminal processing protease
MPRIFLFLGLSALASAQSGDSRLEVETKVWVATKLYSSIQMYFAHAEGAPGFDLDRDYQEYLKAAFAAADRRAFDLASIAFTSKLRNGHSGFYDEWLQKNYGQPLGFTLQPMAAGWVVILSQLAEVNPGDLVVSVGGKPIEEFYAENDGLLEGSSEAARRRSLSWRTYLWPEQFELGLANGKRVAIDRASQKLEKTKTFPFSQGPVKTPEGVGFIRIASFEDSAQEAVCDPSGEGAHECEGDSDRRAGQRRRLDSGPVDRSSSRSPLARFPLHHAPQCGACGRAEPGTQSLSASLLRSGHQGLSRRVRGTPRRPDPDARRGASAGKGRLHR